MTLKQPARELTDALERVPPGTALDLACGAGRHSIWLWERGWTVTAVDILKPEIPQVKCVRADLKQPFDIAPGAWDLILCWLYWSADLLPGMARGVRPGGVAAMAGKTGGRFATSLAAYRAAFPDWTEIAAGESETRAFFIARRPL